MTNEDYCIPADRRHRIKLRMLNECRCLVPSEHTMQITVQLQTICEKVLFGM